MPVPWYRSVTITIVNNSGCTLVLQEPIEFPWGQWAPRKPDGKLEPPECIKRIAPGATDAECKVENDSIGFDGVEGKLVFKVEGDGDSTWEISWDNPWLGSNLYVQTRRNSEALSGVPKNNDKVDDDEAKVTYTCMKVGDVIEVGTTDTPGSKAPEVQVVDGAANQEILASSAADPVNVVIIPDVESESGDEHDKAYYSLCKWGQDWAANPPSGEKRDFVKVKPTVALTPGATLSASNRASYRDQLRTAILAAYDEALKKQKGGGGLIVHAVGHGLFIRDVTVDKEGHEHITKYGGFDLGAQTGGFSQHLLVPSDLAFDANIWPADEGQLNAGRRQEERDNWAIVQEIGKKLVEVNTKTGKYIEFRVLTCALGDMTYLPQRVSDALQFTVTCYKEHIKIAPYYDKNKAITRWDIGLQMDGVGEVKWAGPRELPKTTAGPYEHSDKLQAMV
jgi:hypothetical protein